MASTYTLNNGIQLIGTGDQSGTWGDTTNTNFELIDTSLDGQVVITLGSAGTTGSPNEITINEGTASNARNRMYIVNESSTYSGDAYLKLNPNDAEKIVYVRNNFQNTNHSLVLFQGTYDAANAYSIPKGKTAVVYFDGAGSGAVAANMFDNAHFDALNIVGNADVGGNLTITGDVVAGDDVSLKSDDSVLNFGLHEDVNLTHIPDTALRLNTDKAIQFREAGISINSSTSGQLDIDATTVDINATTLNVPANSIALGTDTTGNYVASVTGGTGLSSTGSGEGAAVTVGLSAEYGDDLNPYGNKSANLILAGPNSGSDSPPSFRSLVAADIPSLAISKISGLQSSLDLKLNLTGGAISSDLTIAGDVGIGIVSPSAILNVGIPNTETVGTLYTTTRNHNDSSNRVDLLFKYKYNSGGSYATGSQISFAKESTADGNYGSDIRLLTRENGQSTSEKVRIKGDGKVGIGTTSPAVDLDVNGTIRSASGILFGSDTAAANTLHDYEEGTFDPYYTAQTSDFDYIEYYPSTATSQSSHKAYRGSTSGANSYIKHDGSVRGWYTKIGEIVHISIWIYTQSISTTGVSGNIRIGGLPYAPPVGSSSPFSSYIFNRKAFNSLTISYNYYWDTAPTMATLFNDGFIYLFTQSSNTSDPTTITVSDFNTGTAKNILNITGCYRVEV
tara:strand:+ start:38 stop:2068 length:2031 start_codon:yes stop_codon:yes gene_type:complete